MRFPDEKPPGIPPDGLDDNLVPLWCTVRNEIVKDQERIHSLLAQIKAVKHSIAYTKSKIMSNSRALDALGQLRKD